MLHGAKRWFLFPKEITPTFDPDESQLQWTLSYYPTLRDEHAEGLGEGGDGGGSGLLECVIYPGEKLYFPSQWYHATLNLEPYTVFVSSFT